MDFDRDVEVLKKFSGTALFQEKYKDFVKEIGRAHV